MTSPDILAFFWSRSPLLDGKFMYGLLDYFNNTAINLG
jgi:hypothetical protein